MAESASCAAVPSFAGWVNSIEHHPLQALAVTLFGSLVIVGFAAHLESIFRCNYLVRVFVWEALFIPIPDIVLDDLPSSVTEDDGVKSPAPVDKKPRPLIDPQKPGMIQCYDPTTQQWLGQVPAMTEPQVNEVCRKSAEAQKEWKRTSFAQRRTVLRTIQKYMVQHVDEICRTSARDSGKPVVDAALGEVLTTAEKIRTIVAAGELWLEPDRRAVGPMFLHKRAQVEYVPLGVIGTIAPWNYPYVVILVVVLLSIGGCVARKCILIHNLSPQVPQLHESYHFGHLRREWSRWQGVRIHVVERRDVLWEDCAGSSASQWPQPRLVGHDNGFWRSWIGLGNESVCRQDHFHWISGHWQESDGNGIEDAHTGHP
jgi:hypothetical protein